MNDFTIAGKFDRKSGKLTLAKAVEEAVAKVAAAEPEAPARCGQITA